MLCVLFYAFIGIHIFLSRTLVPIGVNGILYLCTLCFIILYLSSTV